MNNKRLRDQNNQNSGPPAKRQRVSNRGKIKSRRGGRGRGRGRGRGNRGNRGRGRIISRGRGINRSYTTQHSQPPWKQKIVNQQTQPNIQINQNNSSKLSKTITNIPKPTITMSTFTDLNFRKTIQTSPKTNIIITPKLDTQTTFTTEFQHSPKESPNAPTSQATLDSLKQKLLDDLQTKNQKQMELETKTQLEKQNETKFVIESISPPTLRSELNNDNNNTSKIQDTTQPQPKPQAKPQAKPQTQSSIPIINTADSSSKLNHKIIITPQTNKQLSKIHDTPGNIITSTNPNPNPNHQIIITSNKISMTNLQMPKSNEITIQSQLKKDNGTIVASESTMKSTDITNTTNTIATKIDQTKTPDDMTTINRKIQKPKINLNSKTNESQNNSSQNDTMSKFPKLIKSNSQITQQHNKKIIVVPNAKLRRLLQKKIVDTQTKNKNQISTNPLLKPTLKQESHEKSMDMIKPVTTKSQEKIKTKTLDGNNNINTNYIDPLDGIVTSQEFKIMMDEVDVFLEENLRLVNEISDQIKIRHSKDENIENCIKESQELNQETLNEMKNMCENNEFFIENNITLNKIENLAESNECQTINQCWQWFKDVSEQQNNISLDLNKKETDGKSLNDIFQILSECELQTVN